MATDNFWARFRRWRRHRPFWGGLILVLSALELFLSANMTLGGIEVHLGPQGFLSYLLPLLILVCGLLAWFTPAQRLFYGIIALLSALYSFVGLNLGGFFVGMLLGIVGGALVIAWGPPRVRPDAPLDSPDSATPSPTFAAPASSPSPTFAAPASTADAPTERIEIAGHDDRPPPVRSANDPLIPGMQHEEAPARRLGRNPKALAVGVIALILTGSFLVAGSTMPASAEDCPEGLPSRSSTSAPASSAAASAAARARVRATTTAPRRATTPTPTSKPTSAPVSASPTAGGNPVVDGIHDLVDGVGNLLGINDEESSSPSTSPTPSETTSAPSSPTPSPTASSAAPAPTTPAATTAPTRAAQPSASSSEIPCLGARIYGKTASADDIPQVSAKPGLLEVASLTMYSSSYDGVVDMPTRGGGSFKALKFSMDKVVNKGFTLTVDEKNGGRTVIRSNELTTDENVRFYTPSFQGKLFGLIPVTFTPEQPPPLTLPILWFTDTKIQLAYVRCDTLTADPLDLREQS